MPKPVQIGAATVLHGDCIALMPTLGPVDSIVTDPPYHLTSGNIAFDWDALGPSHNPAGAKRDPITGLFVRSSRTNQSSRGHKSGFMGQRWDGGDIAFRPETWRACFDVLKPGGYLLAFGGTRTHHRIWCAIEDAGFVIQDTISWNYGSGFPKGRTQLKPAWEPICVAYKPGGKRMLQIDEARVPAESRSIPVGSRIDGNNVYGPGLQGDHHSRQEIDKGRWPADVAHDGSAEVMEAFAAFGTLTSGKPIGTRKALHHFGTQESGTPLTGFGDSGSAARFFYAAKASKADRAGSKHPTVKPIALMRWLVRLVTPPGGLVLDPFAGSGTTGAAALAEGRRTILIEREAEYFADIKRRLKALPAQLFLPAA